MALTKMWKRIFGRKARKAAQEAREQSPGYQSLRRFLRPIPLSLEYLEDRVTPTANPWDVTLTPNAAAIPLQVTGTNLTLARPDAFEAATDQGASERQVFFLAMSGADDVDYRGPVTVEDIDVPAFVAPTWLAGQETAILGSMLNVLHAAFPGSAAEFTTVRPTGGEFSTIYVGGDGAPFAPWGHYYGLVEQIDAGNLDHSDIAFVFSDAIDASRLSAVGYGQQLAEVVAHEAGHLLGEAHDHDHDHDHGPLAGVAFDPKVHVEIGLDVVADVIADGKVTIAGAEYDVHPKIVAALQNHLPYYNAGSVGPDGFPDVLMGQFAVHPIDHGTWLTRVLDMAWQAQSDSSFSATEQSQILAWSYGYLTHSAGDHWAHTLVNEFAEGVAPGFGAAGESIPTDQRDLGNMLRHFMTEAYIADALPGFDNNKDRTILPDGDVSDDSTPGIPFAAPTRFIYETLIRPFPDDPTPIVEMDWEGGTLAASAATDTFTRSAGDFVDDGFKIGHKITVSGFTNPANNGTFLVTAVSPTVLTVAGALANETASGDEKIVVRIPKTGLTTMTVDAAAGTFTRASGSFVAEGFIAGQRFAGYGFTANHGDFIVKSVTPTVLTVVGKLAAGDEVGTGDEQLVVYGQRGPALDNIFKLRDRVFQEAVSRGDRGAPGELGNVVANLIDKVIQGQSIPDTLKDDLIRAYLYNWVDEIDEGVRHWGEVGLAFTKALFDPQSRRDLQNKVAAKYGADTLGNALRANAEAGVGILDVFIEELDDPNGDGSTGDSFINQHLLPMAGLPAELGLLRQGLQALGDVVDDILAPLQVLFNPIRAAINDVKTYVTDFIKDQIKERFGFDFAVFEYMKDLSAKMDLKTIGVGSKVVPVFKPGDHEKLDALMGLTGDHHNDPPAGFDLFPGVSFYTPTEGPLTDGAQFSKTAFAAYANSVTLTKMMLLMETPPDGSTTGAGQLSALYSDLTGTAYDFTLLNTHGAHGGNVMTSTLPGVGTAPWLNSIDADQVWRQDNYTTTNALFRVSTQNDTASPAEWKATGLTPGEYRVYATWRGNVTQDLDNLGNADFADQKLSPASNAQYTVFNDATAFTPVTKNQRLFATDFEHDGLAYAEIGTFDITTGTLRVRLSNVADGHVVAGPVLIQRVAGGLPIIIQNSRDPVTLAPLPPADDYTDNPASWTDLAYPTGTGNNPLWESAVLRPAFRTLFADWQNGSLDFPDLGDATSPDPNSPSIVQFDTTLSALTNDHKFLLDAFAAFLLANPLANATVSGHTDTVGDAADNLLLSQDRANAVSNYLQSKGVPASQLTVNWFGETQLLVPTGDGVAEPRNRRVELSVVVAPTPLPSHATPFGPVVADNQLQVPIPDSLKNAIQNGLNDLVALAQTLESAPPLSITLPVIDKSLAELLDLSGNIDRTLRTPVANYFATDSTPTVNELLEVVRTNFLGSVDGLSAVLDFEFKVDLRKTFSVDNLALSLGQAADAVGLELGGTLDVDAAVGFVDALVDDLPKLTFGIDLTPADPAGSIPLDQRVYVKADRALLSADIHATNLDFGARFGFLGVGVVNGEVNLNTDVTLTFNDPNSDGKITLAEIAGTPLATLIDIDFAGTLDGNLPIEVSGLPGFLDTTIGTVVFGATDVFDLGTYSVEFDGNFDRVFSFNNIDAASLVGLLGQLTFWLDEFRRSDEFANLDVPLVGPALDKVLGVADAFRDKLLLDDADNGLDGATTLVFDINAALEAAGLGDRIRAENSAGKIRLVANDASITQFSVAATSGLGFAASQSSSGLATDIFESITAANLAPANGRLAADVTLLLSIDGAPASDVRVFKSVGPPAFDASTAVEIGTDRLTITGHGLRTGDAVTYDTGGGTEVDGLTDGATYFVIKVDDNRLKLATTFANATATTPVAVDLKTLGAGDGHTLRHAHNTDDNVGIGDDRWKLVDGENAPTFSTTQEMILKLTEIFGLSDLAYDQTAQTLTWSLNLSETFGQLDLPLGFSLDELPSFLKLQTSGNVRIAADGALNLTLGVFLGPAEASTKLDGTELLSELNGGIDISTDQRITGAAAVRTVYGQLSADAKFSLAVDGGTPVNVLVTKAATSNNATAQHLADDINAALATAGLGAQVEARTVTDTPDQQRVKLVGLAGVTSIKLTTTSSDPTVKDMGFAAQQPATGAPATAELVAPKDLVALRGRLTGTASFDVSLNNVNGGAPFTITVQAADTATNRFAFDVINDVQAAIDSHAALIDKIEVGFSDGRLTLTAKNGATAFSLANVNTVAANELGLAAGMGNSVDFVITVRDGSSHSITLDGLTTLSEVIAAISTQSGGEVTATINDRETGLTLTDNTFDVPAGTGTFAVRLANNSAAALGLGIVQADAPEDPPEGEEADGVIEGTDIAGLTPLDRFFIQATPVGGPALGSIGVDISTPTALTASASFGFAGLSLVGGGALPSGKALEADLTLRLNEPAGSTDGRVSLAELINGLDDLGSLIDISLTGVGKAEFDLIPDPALADLGITLGTNARIAVDVNLGDVFADTPVAPTIDFTYPDFGDLLRFGNLDFNFQSIIAGLRQLTDFLDQFEAFDFLDKPLPVAGVSISELISVADKFATAIDDARSNPAGTLQFLEAKLKEAFGLPAPSTAINLVLVNDDNGTPGITADDFDILKFEINLAAAFSEAVAVDFDLGLSDAGLPLELGGGANLTAAGSVALKLAIGFDIADPTRLFMFDSTGLEGSLDLGGTGLAFRAAVGPLGVFVNGGSVDLHGNVEPGNKLFDVGFNNLDYVNNRVEIDFGDLGALFDGFSAQVGGEAHVSLPVFFPTDSIRAGTVLLDAALGYDSNTGEFTSDFDPRAIDENNNPIPLAQLFAVNPADFSLLDQLLIGVDGMDLFLEGLQDVLDGQIGSFSLPLIGDKLAGVADVIGDFREDFVEGFRQALEQLANPGAAFAAAGSGADPVSKILFNLLGPSGLDLLLDSDDAGSEVTVADVKFVTNVNVTGVAPRDVFFDWDFKLGTTLVDVGAGIGFDVGIPGLGLKTTGDVNLNIDWELALGFGLNYADGFYFDIADASELELNVDVTVPGIGITGTLGFLQVTATEDNPGVAGDPVTHLGATFAIDVKNRGDTPTQRDLRLAFTELGRVGIDAKIGADAVVDLAMRLALSSDLIPNAPTNFPSVVADFMLDWRLGNRAAGEYVSLSDLDGSFLSNGLQYVGFDHVGLDLGTYFTNLIGPIVEKVQEVTEPIKPFLDFLTEPIPVISQLAGPTSLLDIAAMSGLVNPGIIKAIEVVDQVIDLANSINTSAGSAILYFDRWLPSLVIFDAANPPAGGLLDLTNPNLDLDQLADDLLGGLGNFLPGLGDVVGDAANELFAGVTKMLPGGSASGGFELPIIDDPSQVFGMLMGRPADLVTFTMDALEVEAEFSAFFSIFGPLGVSINAEFAAQFGPFKFGYDTFGITQFAASGFRNPLLLFDGLYVSDLDVATGQTDVPELQFDAGLWAAAELNLGIARGGVGGGLFAEIDFDLHDPDDDGKVRVKEIITNVLNEFRYGNPALSPLAMFDITGQLTARLFAFIKIKLGFFKLEKEFNITPPIVLLDFESNFERYATLATELPSGVLQLNMGKFAGQRIEGDLTDLPEEFHVKQDGPGRVKVWAPSLGIDESEAQSYEVSSRIIALGGEGNDVIDLHLVTDNLQYELEGGAGDDIIKAGSGTGAARILGGAGNDDLSGGAGDDTIFGEAGGDVIRGGGGKDWLFGDGSVKDAIQGNTITVGVKANDGSDSIFGDGGEDLLFGSGGSDTLEGGADADVLIGDGGKVTVGADRRVVTVRPAADDPGRLELAVADTSKGNKGAGDTLRGDGGADHLYGGVGNDDLSGGADADVLYGETGRDTIDGGAGDDIAFGDFGTFVVINSALTPVVTVGGESDVIHGGTEHDKLLGGAGDDVINGNAGNDWVWGGTGLDTIHGNDGDDHLYGNADPDQLFGDAGADFLEGGHGNDIALGGTGNDFLVAGYGSDVLDGQEGSDAYQITARGGSVTELSTAYDSGTLATETDTLTLIGTAAADTVLLRAMADFYFPTLVKLIGDNTDPESKGLTDRIFESSEPDKLAATFQAIEDSYGPHDIPTGLVGELTDLFVAQVRTPVLDAVAAHHVPGAAGSTVPTLAALQTLVEGILDSESTGKLAEIQKAIAEAYGLNPVPAGMADALTNAFQPPAALKGALEGAIATRYQSELAVLGSETDTGFVALINDGGADVERFNYRNMEGLVVNTLQGDDYVVSDDVIAATTINLGIGEDRVQIGQVFRSERTRDPDGQLITGIKAEDVYTTTEITRGWLSNGVSRPTTVNGGDGNDEFTVFRNVAVLNLNGGDGDDLFTVRAFALKGSSDNERARTDMKGDAGADTILYVVNAPVGIDGGDGFDTVRVIGTEFGDDFVVTDSGVFGAGLNVSYVNIEKLIADGAEGDDRYFVLSTGLDVVTEIDGGLGSDTFFIGGNPSRAPIPVISDDFRGHSGIILHSVESTDAAWNGLKVEGLSANVGDDEEDYVIVTESGGSSRVVEGATAGGSGWAYDGYGIRLTHAPGAGQSVTINVVPAGMSPEDIARQFRDLEFYAPSTVDGPPAGSTLGFNPLTGLPNLPSLIFTTGNWHIPQYIKFRAANDAASEGRRFTFINHTAQNSTDPDYREAQLLSVKVQLDDDDRDGVIVTPTGRGNTVLEAGFTDSYDVVLAKQPTADVTVALSVLNGQVTLSGPDLTFPAGVPTLTFTAANWATPRTVTLTAVGDAVLEGFHTDYISFTVQSADDAQTVTLPSFVQIDGDFDLLGVQDVPADKPTTYVLLPHRPVAGSVSVKVAGVVLDPARFSVVGNTLSFLAADASAELILGKVESRYSYLEAGYDGTAVKDAVVDVYDADAPTVIVEQTDGSTDVIEGSAVTDTYRVRLSRAPTQNVIVNADAVPTRTTYGRTANFVEQVTVNGLSLTALTFTPDNWDEWQTVTVAAIDDNFLDGNDTQVFAPDLQTVNKIRGPLIVEGAAGAGSLSLPAPLMLPTERNVLEPDGNVVAFTPGNGGGATETMTVERSDLLAVVAELRVEDSTITSIQDLIGKTLEMSKGPGTGVILDPARPQDLYDRFWLINAVEDLGNGNVRLTLQNPTLVDPGQPNVTAPNATSEYAITALSINFFADEREQVDYLFVFDEDSVANDAGALTSSDGAVLDFTAGATDTMTADTVALQAVAKLSDLTDLNALVGRKLEITVGPGVGRSWTIAAVTDGLVAGTKLLTLTPVTAGAAPTNRSEFRIAGGDTHGRITGFGMGPNILFAGKPQPGGITYGDIEVVQVSLGSGNDTVRVDYTTNAEDHTTRRSGDFHTLTLLDTGAGDDTVTVTLTDGDDGAIAISTQAGNDTVQGAASTLPLVAFGGDGNDQITGGSGADILFGDLGRVDYVNDEGEIVTRLGHSVPPNPVNQQVEASTATTLFDGDANFSTEFGGLVGLMVQAISPQGQVQFRRVVANTADTLTIDRPWDNNPTFNSDPKLSYFYRVSVLPEDQTDGVVRAPRIIWSINHAVGGSDSIQAGGGLDYVFGGAGGDTIGGGAGGDVIFGDNGRIDLSGRVYPDGLVTSEPVVERLFTTDTTEATGGADTIHGDADNDVIFGGVNNGSPDVLSGDAGDDTILGDDGKLIYDAPVAPGLMTLDIIQTGNVALGGPDTIYGDAGNDLVFAGKGGDWVEGGSQDDLVFGDFAAARLLDNMINVVETTDANDGAADTVFGNEGDDLLVGGAAGDAIDGGSADDLIFGDAVRLQRRAVSTSPRFHTLSGSALYDSLGNALIDGAERNDPDNTPAQSWAVFQVVNLYHSAAIQTAGLNDFGNDYIAGGADNDTIFGQLGNDVIQGDGSIAGFLAGNPVAASRSGDNLLLTPSFESTTDGDDYVEGNGGADTILGNLGQDDLIGGSSSLFTLTTQTLRPDGDDIIFGGAGTRVARNDAGDDSENGHARDADMILGDNGNIFRLVTGTGEYVTFTYDYYSPLKIIPRVVTLLDYTRGGSTSDTVGHDLLLGESGDDIVHGMGGKDVLFGNGQDDDLYGESGADRIYGGAGEDGVLGDDGVIQTSRNGLTEPLHRVTSVNAEVEISLPGPFTGAWIFITGRLNKSPDLLAWEQGGNDVIYGGLGDDFLHGGAGNDGISGAEARAVFHTYAAQPDGDPLGYDPVTRKLAAYDANNPMTKIAGFFLNFDPTDGTGAKINDGKDRLFGDLGHDWLVGGTQNDRLFGGKGDDVHNLDDNHDTAGGLNNQPDPSPFADRDFAYGGDGLDVLIANTGGDRMYDWGGEFNSYLVPFSPFGNPTVVRSPAPHIRAFILALGRESGADQTLTEPNGELGLFTHSDPEWQANHGGPRDPQPGNSHFKRDTQGSPEDDRNTALPLTGTGTASLSVNSGLNVALASVYVEQDVTDPTRNTLYVGGTDGDDVIEVRRGANDSMVRVVVNGVTAGEFNRTTLNLKQVIVYGNDGNDTITVNNDLPAITALLFGGEGDDTIRGGRGTNYINGGSGNDSLYGNTGVDVMIGGDGADLLDAASNDDLLIGGIYTYGEDYDAIDFLLTTWTPALSYTARQSALRAGNADGLFGLSSTTILGDGDVDVLRGEQGQDWFWVDLLDTRDKKGNEDVN